MALIQSDYAQGIRMTPVPDSAGDVVACRFDITLTKALAAGDIVELGVLPGNGVPVDAILESDDLDTGGAPAIALDVGIMSGPVGKLDAARTCGNELFAASTVGRAGGVERMTAVTGFRIQKSEDHRSIGVKVATAPQVGAVTGKLALILFYVQGTSQ
ncbi:hypothetical protein UAM5_00020 [Ralstonia phage UAM5]|nr:hypothetical protein UAM5_00020 [Ralstonia phage UAM5]